MVLSTLRDDLPFAILAPTGNFVVFNFGLRNVIDTGDMSYCQYLLPVIIVQVMLLGALTTVDRAARDHTSDFGVRLRTLPISAAVPLTARMLYCLFRGALALLVVDFLACWLRRVPLAGLPLLAHVPAVASACRCTGSSRAPESGSK